METVEGRPQFIHSTGEIVVIPTNKKSCVFQTIGAEDGDLISFEKTNYEETHFELPPLGDRMNNLVNLFL